MSSTDSKNVMRSDCVVVTDSVRSRRQALASMSLTLVALSVAPLVLARTTVIPATTQKSLLSNPGTPMVGPETADVTIVEYLDYNCPVCKDVSATLRALLSADHNTALVYKDWAILGDVSVYAAHAALAAKWQGKYLVAHDALMAEPDLPDNNRVDAVLKRAGIDMAKLGRDRLDHAKEIDTLLQRNNAEARALGFQGTPGLLVGRQALPGVVDLKGFKQLLTQARGAR